MEEPSEGLSLRNSTYWSQLCGSRAARKLGIQPGDARGVSIFDEWFFDFYPYLADSTFIPWRDLSGKSVLEIGLGYGSVTRRAAVESKVLCALDISLGPVKFARDTSSTASGLQGSALGLPFAANTFDVVIAIGCLHHTGNMARAFEECMRVLRTEGRLVAMVYNRYSYKRWIVSPVSTFASWCRERRDGRIPLNRSAPRRVSWFWDRGVDGSAPPHTEFASVTQIREILNSASTVKTAIVNVDNFNDVLPMRFQRRHFDGIRKRLLKVRILSKCGLDLYVTATK